MKPRPELLPVVLGGDLGAYSVARAFYEAYGVVSTVISGFSTGLVRDSKAIENIVEPRIDDPDVVVARLKDVAAAHPDRTRILLGSADWHVRTIVARRADLDEDYIIPYADMDQLLQATDKESFAELCMQLGIGHPQTLVYPVGSGEPLDTRRFTYPVIAKAADSPAYHRVEFPGKKKVFRLKTADELARMITAVTEAGYRGGFVIQDYVPGPDTQMRVLTTYSDRQGVVRFACFGQVLVEEYTPGALGNSAAIITDYDEGVVADAVRLLEHLHWRGYACFDIKLDPRDGTYRFLEMNARLGRGNYYLTAAGANPATNYVHEYVDGGFFSGLRVCNSSHLYTVLPRRLMLKYMTDENAIARAKRLIRRGEVTNPLWSRIEHHPRRLFYVAANQFNQVRKFKRFYPSPDPAHAGIQVQDGDA